MKEEVTNMEPSKRTAVNSAAMRIVYEPSFIWDADDTYWSNLFGLPNDKPIEDVFMTDIYSLDAYDRHSTLHDNINQNKEPFINEVVDILNQQRFLSIIGGYGSGKTILSKFLYKHLSKYKVKAISAHELYNVIKNDEFTKFKNYLKNHEIEYLFLDEMDDIDFKEDINGKKLNFFEETMQELWRFLKENAILKVLINSRNLKSSLDDISLYLAIQFFDNSKKNVDKFIFINTSPIKSINKQKWLLKFFDDNKEHDNKKEDEDKKKERVQYFLNSLKNTDRKLPNSLSNPLMLYIIFKTYTEDTNNKNYDYVRKIIDDTIRGKFISERGSGSLALKDNIRAYKELVYTICYGILEKSESDAYDVIYDEKDGTEFGISNLKKDNLFCKIKDFSEFTRDMISVLNKENNFIVKENYFLNCYFWKIDMKEDIVFMKDTNILFYLAAQKQKPLIENFLKNEHEYESCEKFYEELEKLNFCGFNYHVIDYLLAYFKSENETYKLSIIDSMRHLSGIVHSKKISNKLMSKKIAFFFSFVY
jgi:tRNA A37 threonylcarbamoyladenosine biosynthesis protein TsaE